MISHQALNARGENKHGSSVIDYLVPTPEQQQETWGGVGYYAGDDAGAQEMARYGGKGAQALGLVGRDVGRDDMLQLAAGFAPDTGEALCQNAGEAPHLVTKTDKNGNAREVWEGGHRVGFDFTFSPPKAPSVLFALYGEEAQRDVLRAQRIGAQDGMNYLESKVETRRGKGGKDVIGVDGLVYSQHDHVSSRQGDAQIHTHTLIYGVAQGEDGKWGTYDAKELYRHTRAADMIYQNSMASALRDMGYPIEQREVLLKNGETVKQWGIVGISEELCDAFSTRRAQILEYQSQNGGTAQQACLATRKDKDEPSQEELKTLWREVAEGLGHDKFDLETLKQGQDKKLPEASRSDLLNKLHANESVVCEHDLVKLIGNEHMGFMKPQEIFKAVDEFKQGLHRVEPKALHAEDRGATVAREFSETRYQAPYMKMMENLIVETAKKREAEDTLKLPAQGVERAITHYEREKKFTLTEEQKTVIRHQTTQTGGVCVVEGYAGTGKTTVSDVVKRAFDAEGFTMVGVAISNKAAMKLAEESGMEARSVTKTLSMLDKGTMALTDRHVMVVDEAGMLDTRNTLALMQHADKAGAKIILQGDENQLQPIMAGSGFMLAKQSIGAEQLTEIRRQETQEGRDIARSFYRDSNDVQSKREERERGHMLAEKLEEHAHPYQKSSEARDALLKSYLEKDASADDKLMLVSTHDDADQLTASARKHFKQKGVVGLHDYDMKCKTDDGFVERQFAQGDRVRFTTANNDLGVVNGTEGILREIKRSRHDGGLELDVETAQGRVKFNSHEFSALCHNYAITVHGAQGQGKDWVYQLYNQGMADRESMLVGYTRCKKGYELYGQVDELDNMYQRLGMERKKQNALTPEAIKAQQAQAQEPRATEPERKDVEPYRSR